MNQWTAPDAYAGNTDDPMSQHPYMWNNNNPVEYSDPSGYNPAAIAIAIGIGEGIGAAICWPCAGFGALAIGASAIVASEHDENGKKEGGEVAPRVEVGPGPRTR